MPVSIYCNKEFKCGPILGQNFLLYIYKIENMHISLITNLFGLRYRQLTKINQVGSGNTAQNNTVIEQWFNIKVGSVCLCKLLRTDRLGSLLIQW